jgi:predicted amidohydrolase YtcJ
MAARLTAVIVAAIVGVTLVAGLIVGAQRDDDSGPIDLLIYNGRVYTGVAERPFAEAVAVRGNRIYRVGSNRDIKRLRRRATTVVDAHGGSVFAGFTDVDATLPARASRPSSEPETTVRAEPASTPPATPPGDDESAIREAVEGAHRLGLTSVGITLDGPDALEALERLREKDDQLALRVVAAIRVAPPIDEAYLARIEALRTAPDADPMVRVDAIALDVTLAPEKAQKPSARSRKAVAEPQAPTLAKEEERLVKALDKRGLTLVLRVDDERELSAALDALARTAAENAAPSSGRRHRLVLLRPMPFDAERVKAAGAIVSLPLPAAWSPETLAEASPDTEPATALPSALEGVRIVMSSDTLADPRLGLQALVAPKSTDPAARAEIVNEQLLSAALRTLTADAAAAQGDDRRRGTVAKDMLADLVVLSADLFTLPPDKLLDAVVTLTVLDGKVVYDREADAPTATDP